MNVHLFGVLLAVHPTCVPFVRQRQEVLFQAQSALNTARNELRRLQSRREKMEMLTQEGAISLRQWQQFQADINRTRREIADMEKMQRDANAQITTLRGMPQCRVS